MELIYKSALVAEIEKRISRNKERKEWEDIPEKRHQLIIEGQLLGELKHFLDSLEVKEVDFEDTMDETKDEAMRDIAWKVHVMISKGKSVSEIDHYVCGICDF